MQEKNEVCFLNSCYIKLLKFLAQYNLVPWIRASCKLYYVKSSFLHAQPARSFVAGLRRSNDHGLARFVEQSERNNTPLEHVTDVKAFRSSNSCIWDVFTKSDVSRIATGRTQKLLHFRTIIRHFAKSRRRSTLFRPASTSLGCVRVSRPCVQAERKNSLTSRKYTISHQRSLPLAQTHLPVILFSQVYTIIYVKKFTIRNMS